MQILVLFFSYVLQNQIPYLVDNNMQIYLLTYLFICFPSRISFLIAF